LARLENGAAAAAHSFNNFCFASFATEGFTWTQQYIGLDSSTNIMLE
jgi:hypothetical protein